MRILGINGFYVVTLRTTHPTNGQVNQPLKLLATIDNFHSCHMKDNYIYEKWERTRNLFIEEDQTEQFLH